MLLLRANSVYIVHKRDPNRANEHAQRAKRQTMSTDDIMAALEELEFEDFIEPLNAYLEGANPRAEPTSPSPLFQCSHSRHRGEEEESGGGGQSSRGGSG